MSLLLGTNTYWEFLGQCTECGHCREACPSLSCAGMNLGQIAKRLLKLQREALDAADGDESQANIARLMAQDSELVQAVRGCFFCTQCTQACFAHNDVTKLIYAARTDFQNQRLIPREAWTSVQVDQEWDIFTAYRAIHGIGYADLTRHYDAEGNIVANDFETAFFPGCSLAAYAPELTREVFATIEELGGKTTMIDRCCGSSLKSAGFSDRAIALCDLIVSELAATGVKRVVCVCPGCANDISIALARNGVELEALTAAEFLLQKGFTPKRSFEGKELCFSKSCQDRKGYCLDATRELMGVSEDAITVFKGCCGAGGAVSAFDANRQAQQVDTKMANAQDGQTLVTMCPTCTYTYAYRLMSAPRDIKNKHYLELMFESQIDWEKNFNQLGSMWSGQYGAWLAQVFA